MEDNKNIKKRVLPFLLKKEKQVLEEKKNINEVPISVDINTDVSKVTEDTTKEKISISKGSTSTTTSTTTTQEMQDVEPIISNLISEEEILIPTFEEDYIIEKPTTIEKKEIVSSIPLIPKEEAKIIETEAKTNNTIELEPLTKVELTHLAIIEEIKEYIDDELSELNEIASKIKVLKEDSEKGILLEEQQRIQRELEQLIKRIEELRKKYDKLYGKLQIDNIKIIDNDVLEISIKDFIEDTKEGQDTSKYFDQIEEVTYYLDILDKLVEVDNDKDQLTKDVDEKIDLFEQRDEDFEQAQDEFIELDKINTEIDKYNAIVSKAIDELEEKLDQSVEITRRTETTTRRAVNFGRILAATYMLARSTTIPPTPRGNFIRGTLVGVAVHLLLNSTYRETTTRTITHVDYTDLKQEILSSKDLVTESLKLIGNSFDELEEIKKNFEKEFKEYANEIPEYAMLIKNIIDLEKELQRQEEKAYIYSKEIDEQLNENYEKVKIKEEIESS